MHRPPPRLFVLIARDAEQGLIIRRGPTDWAHLIKWDMRRDRFEPGAWLKGRLYAERCDLSPDGALLLYFVHKGTRHGTSYTIAWTGVSRAPWLHALALWPWGSTWGGGGRFLADRHMVLRSGPIDAHPDHPPRGLSVEFGNAAHHASTDEVPGADWSGRDHQGRLVFTRRGVLYRRGKKREDVALADFNGMEPDPQAAPVWATRKL